MRTKLQAPGSSYATVIWNRQGQLMPWPETWVGSNVRASQVLSTIWLNPTKWGCTLSTQGAMLEPLPVPRAIDPVFPFGDSGDSADEAK